MFKIGDEVAYGMHGKCLVTGIYTKELSSGPVEFYQIRVIKNPIAAKTVNPQDPAILVPVLSAATNGLRALLQKEEAEAIIQFLAEPNYHFEIKETWLSKQKKLEECIRKEGATGLAKVVGHLFILKNQDVVPPSNVVKLFDSTFRILVKELGEAMEVLPKDLEPMVMKALKAKLAADN